MNSLSLEAIRIGDICYASVSVSDLFFSKD